MVGVGGEVETAGEEECGKENAEKDLKGIF